MKINQLNQTDPLSRLSSVTPVQTAPVASPKEAPIVLPDDKAEVSRDVQTESRLLDAAKMVYDALPDTRTDKIALARQRISEGYYGLPPVLEEIASRMLSDSEAKPARKLTATDQKVVKDRIDQGYYDQPQAAGKIAAGLADDAAE